MVYGAAPHHGLVLRAGASLFGADKTLKPIAELRAGFEGVGTTPDKRVLVYCGGGIAATLDAFVLDGGSRPRTSRSTTSRMQEWSNHPSLPMERLKEETRRLHIIVEVETTDDADGRVPQAHAGRDRQVRRQVHRARRQD